MANHSSFPHSDGRSPYPWREFPELTEDNLDRLVHRCNATVAANEGWQWSQEEVDEARVTDSNPG